MDGVGPVSGALDILQHTFGYDGFRDQQQAIVESLVSGQDALVLMPTGGGKSLCYQIPALLREGVGIVVSPLIALMQDQVSAMAEVGVRAACLNSSLSMDQVRAVESQLASGYLDLLYVAPERLIQERTLQLLVDQIAGLSADAPVVMILEDAHWLDPTTQALFDIAIERLVELPVLLLVTFRPGFTPPWLGHAHVTLRPWSSTPVGRRCARPGARR